MEETNNSEGNSHTDLSPTTPLSAQESPDADSEVLSPPMMNGKSEFEGQSTMVKESETSALQLVLGSPASDLTEVIPAARTEELESRMESIVEGTLDAVPHSLDVPKVESSDIIQQVEKDGDSVVAVDAPIDDAMLSETSSAMKVTSEDPLHAASNELNRDQEEVSRTSNKTLGPIIPSHHVKLVDVNRALVDTAAPFESVRQAVTKFGGIVDWKAHKILTVERQKHMELELKKAHEEIPECRKQSEAAEDAKERVLHELDSRKRLVEELKLELERTETEEEQAKQDSKLAQLRVEEMEQGIADEASIAAKAQVEVAKARHATTIADLKSVKDELEALKSEYASLINDKDVAVRKAEEEESSSKEIEKTVEELTLELMAAKESLESAHAAHLEAEELRIAAAMAREQESLVLEKEMKQSEQELEKLNEQLSLSNYFKSKLETASALLLNLKAQLAGYIESKLDQETTNNSTEVEEKLRAELDEALKSQTDTLSAVVLVKKELEEVRANIEKAKEDVKCLRVAALSLKSELEGEKSALVATRQREGMASIAVASLEAELSRIRSELELVQMREKQVREKMVELPKELQWAAVEADRAKSQAQFAQEELRRASEEAEQAKAGASTAESRLHAAIKEIEATKASEKLALAAIKALHESESACEDPPAGVTLSLEEYYALSKKAHEAEKLANARVAAAMSQIEVAKESEMRRFEKLEESNREVVVRKEALRVVREMAERAKERKLGVEQELRKWRAEHEQRRKVSDSAAGVQNPITSQQRSIDEKKVQRGSDGEQGGTVLVPPLPSSKVFVSGNNNVEDVVVPELKKKKKKKSLFPRIVMFLARKKGQSLK